MQLRRKPAEGLTDEATVRVGPAHPNSDKLDAPDLLRLRSRSEQASLS